MAAVEVLQLLQALPFQSDITETAVTGTTTDLSNYASKLESTLTAQENLIIDFTSLKTCLDPASACDDPTNDQQQTFDYKGYVYELLDKQPEKLSSLQSLSVRKLQAPTDKSTNDEHDTYSRFCFGIMQLSSLTELDLSGNSIPQDKQVNLQLWNLQNLKKLSLDDTSLTALPASVGRLRKLETLSLSKNKLKTLPITLGFCEKLQTLNLQTNQFCYIPAVVFELPALREIKRLNNPLTERYNLQAPRYTQQHTRNIVPKNKDEKKVFNPRSLQTLCTKSVFTAKVDYWKGECLGPLQCKILDRLAVDMDICDHCGTVVFRQDTNANGIVRQYEYSVAVLLVTFCELSGVPFLICACSKDCQSAIAHKYGERNIELQKELDLEYEKMMEEANSNADKNDIDLTLNVPQSERGSFTPRLPHGWAESFTPGLPLARAVSGRTGQRRRHRKKCSIM